MSNREKIFCIKALPAFIVPLTIALALTFLQLLVPTLQAQVMDSGRGDLHWPLLRILADPDLFYFLLIAGLMGIALEVLHPATFIPGILGGISLCLALLASTVLPINYGALGLIIISVAFMIAEIFIPAFGILGIGGFIGFVVGSMMVIDADNSLGMRLSLYTIMPICLVVIGAFLTVGFLVIKGQKQRTPTSEDDLVNEIGIAFEDFRSREGSIRIRGEIWAAEVMDDTAIKSGDKVRVVARRGLKVMVQLSRT